MSWLSGLISGKKRRSVSHRREPADMTVALSRSTPRTNGSVQVSSMPKFHGTAADQLHGSRGSAIDRARFRLRSAFTPSQPVVNARMFAGRTEVLKTLIRSIEDQQLHVVLYGDRGIGKTSLLHILSQLAREARYIVRYGSCGEETEFSDLFRSIAKDIPLLYHSDYAPTSDEIEEGRSLADLLPAEGALNVPQVSELLSKLSGTRVLIVLDEFDRADSSAFRRSVAELIKNLSDRSVRVQLVIAGVAANLTELIEHIPSIRRNILGLQVPSMDNTEIEDLIRNGEAVCGLTFDAEAKAFISAVAHGSPYIASLLSQHAGLSAVERSASLVSKGDVAAAIRQAVDEIRHRVSSKSLFHISAAIEKGYGSKLGLLARAALHSGGRLTKQQADIVMGDDGGIAFMEMIGERFGLIRSIDHDPENAFQFSEEGVPVYLWMRLAEDKFAGDASGMARLDEVTG